ncbi:Flp pilus prepilin peptidase, putative [Syntrophotalea carbinolica DSM 2380]|uniref:Flp pilus prepilin peptidase, putative n=1 Tax=Syntrophotalea carbinolica (strain DSM 2380 / NBRC 103641 / GraBd1) TaxID=338963 RepID=Q3A3R9_SYNC1|nr:A24 family peptidase [Syntrophotalea carbinolica]ABA88988.1 Flp pilus prepilin peptidase, putative [Syntrophotalea carbinolica DSM 2380]
MTTTHAIKMTRCAFGLVAMSLAMLFIYRHPSDMVILAASGYLFLICATDTLYSKIPNICTLALITIGLVTNIVISGLPGIIVSITGFSVGLALLLIPFLLGGMGAGDVKALAALGALLGPGKTFQIFLYMGLIGGLLGIIFHLISTDTRKELRHYASMLKNVYLTRDYTSFKNYESRSTYRFPYATAIAFGFFALTSWGDIV